MTNPLFEGGPFFNDEEDRQKYIKEIETYRDSDVQKHWPWTVSFCNRVIKYVKVVGPSVTWSEFRSTMHNLEDKDEK